MSEMVRLQLKDPPKDWALTLAKKIDRGNRLDREILQILVGRPRRYMELVFLLRGKGENNLTQALKRLRLASLIDMRTNFSAKPPYDYYELTELGIDVIYTLAELAAIERLALVARNKSLREAASA